jgi:hypothetical protein
MKIPLLRSKSKPAATGRQRRTSGVESQPVSQTLSYRQRRSDTELNTGRQAQREAIRAAGAKAGHFWLQRFGLIILLVAIVASAVNILTLSDNAKVLPLTTGQSVSFLRNQAAYQTAAEQFLQASIWNRNKLTVDTAQVSRQMMAKFPELNSVSITIPLMAHRPLVYVQSAQPALILVSGSGSFLLDSSGKALLAAPSAASFNAPTLPVLTDQSNLPVKLNQQVLPATNISFIQTVVAQLAAKQINIGALTLPAAASELDVQIAGQPYSAKFNLESNDARQQVGTLLATMAQLQSQHIVPSQYIDVRVDGRAYYK